MSTGIAFRSGAALVSVLFDARFGEPPTRFHPVVGMGTYLALKDKLLQPSSPAYLQLLKGAGFVFVGGAACGLTAWGLQKTLHRLPRPVQILGTAAVLKPLFSLLALLDAGDAVQGALEADDLPGARRLLAWHLVSRDTSNLSKGEVAGAAVSSLAENLTDSIVAPIFYFALFGLPGAAVYRFVNTADAVLGYRTPELEFFGKVAARTDDVLNFIPARLAAALLLVALKVSGAPARKSWALMLTDSPRTLSPNGGLTMALTAAGLGVKLAKRNTYTLNEKGREATGRDIQRTKRLVKLTVLFGFGLYALAGLTHRVKTCLNRC